MSTVEMIRSAIMTTSCDTAKAMAEVLHKGDPLAAAQAVNDALQGLLLSQAFASCQDATAGGKDTSTTPGSSKLASEAFLSGLVGKRSDGRDDKQMNVFKHAKLIPKFPGPPCEHEPELWENYWEKLYAYQQAIKASDLEMAYIIKTSADDNTELYKTLEHLQFSDGTLEAAGFEGVKQCMTDDYAPTGHLIKKDDS